MKDHFSKENLETVVKESKSKAEVLRKLGLAAKGGNYKFVLKKVTDGIYSFVSSEPVA